MPNVILVDDDQEGLLLTAKALKTHGLSAAVHVATTIERGLELAKELNPEVAVIDLSIDSKRGVESGFEILRSITSECSSCRVLVLTGHGSVEYGVRALQNGAASFLEKPADIPHLLALIQDALKQSSLRQELLKLRDAKEQGSADAVIASSSQMQEVLKALRFAASTNQAVFITGETGTGKGLCAMTIHRLSARASKNFVRYQPVFSTPDLVNSDLFGHVKGAFTGAHEDRSGLLQQASGGTLFLDEVDELPPETQISLLGVLQDKKYRALGSSKEQHGDFRLICASNRAEQFGNESGKLRPDFFHRIAHCRIHIPPLRERTEDILPLAHRTIERLRNNEQVTVLNFDGESSKILQGYSWPGNIRQLEAVVEGAAYRAQFDQRLSISATDIALEGGTPKRAPKTFHDQVENFKLSLIEEVLKRHGGNQVQAARELGLERSTLRRILARQ